MLSKGSMVVYSNPIFKNGTTIVQGLGYLNEDHDTRTMTPRLGNPKFPYNSATLIERGGPLIQCSDKY